MDVPQPSPTPCLEIAHVLFMDIVAYSTLPMDHQRRVLGDLQEAVRNTSEFIRAQASDQLIRLPTGDGMALVFFHDPEAPVRCALELSRALRQHPDIKQRMGIHSGPVYRVADINANGNVAGGGINLAQRVMDCGDAGHILVSSTAAEVLLQLSAWRPTLHDLGEVEVKHEVHIHIYNLYNSEAGNSETPNKLRASSPISSSEDSPRVQSLQPAPRTFADSPATRSVTPQTLVREPNEYFEQRRRLPDTAIMKKIWTKPRWRISIFPTEFRKARFRDVDHCKQFILSSYVRVEGWYPYPWFYHDALEIGDQWVAGEIDSSDGGATRTERFVLFRSALFAHNRAFDEIRQLGDRVHAIEILDATTGAFELASRMSQSVALDPSVALTFELNGVEGRQLTWPANVFRDHDAVDGGFWCQEEGFSVSRILQVADLLTRRRESALDVTCQIYSKFGWRTPPRDRLRSEQATRFGSL